MKHHAYRSGVLVLLVASLLGVLPAEAYIGPGAGFALLSSFFVLALSFVLALFSLLFWPFRMLVRFLLRRGVRPVGMVDRVVIVGLDGLDPNLAEQFMDEGKLPNFHRLRTQGTFTRLATSYPAISPAAWSSFTTGVDCSHHNIFDFITRDPRTYQPILSSADIGAAPKSLHIGKWKIPLGKPRVRLLRRSKPFWTILGEHDIFSSIIRVPITFPPEKFNGVLLSGMCTPDLRGTQGTFAHYTTRRSRGGQKEGGVSISLELTGSKVRTALQGPKNDFHTDGGNLEIPLVLRLDEQQNLLHIRVSGQRLSLAPQTYSPWVRVRFPTGFGSKVHGICRFYLTQLKPELDLYVTPVQIDPQRPALPIAHPVSYSVYLSKLMGCCYGTLGLAEDTWALNEGVIDEEAFLKQAYLYFEEREEMLTKAMQRTRKGLNVCVFDTSDRIQHMFFRCLDPAHPANRGKETVKYARVIEEMYQQMDALLGRVMARIEGNTVLIVMSDHGFAPFRRGVNLNTWLLQNGYLVLKSGHRTSGDWFETVDWQHTKAYCLGLTGIFINKKERESQGIVDEGEAYRQLKQELIERLTGIIDPQTGAVAIREVVDTAETFPGPYLDSGADLLVGFNAGYRISWDCASGKVTETIFEDNVKRWSGDHCIDPALVPGVLFCNRRIDVTTPHIRDLAPTVLQLFGVTIPPYMEGIPLIPEEKVDVS